MSKVFVDANVPLHAGGGAHPLREPARRAVRAVGTGELDGVTSAEVLHEVLHRCLPPSKRALAVFDDFARMLAGRILPVEEDDSRRARELAGSHPGLGGRDLVHIAVMQRHGITSILTSDLHFEGIPGISRLDPRDFVPTA